MNHNCSPVSKIGFGSGLGALKCRVTLRVFGSPTTSLYQPEFFTRPLPTTNVLVHHHHGMKKYICFITSPKSWQKVFYPNLIVNFLFNKCFKYNFHYFRGYFWKFRENARNLLNKAIINMIMILSSLVMIKSLSSLILKIDFTEKTGFFNQKKFRD